jgi:cytochrome c2
MTRMGMTAAALACVALLGACGDDSARRDAAMLTGGNPSDGMTAIRRYGCQSCHTIPGLPGPKALVGPALKGIGQRAYIAGVLPNTPDNMTRWIMNPQAVDSKTAMPFLGVTDQDARDIAAYLYSLR